jgi:hypothetical protein
MSEWKPGAAHVSTQKAEQKKWGAGQDSPPRKSKPGTKIVDPLVRFKELYELDELTACHVWHKPEDDKGRVLFFDGERQVDARMFAFVAYNKIIPEGRLYATCASKHGEYVCVNPLHLAARVKRTRKQSAFTVEEVQDIRRRYRAGQTIREISKSYPDAADKSVYNAAVGRTYEWVTE